MSKIVAIDPDSAWNAGEYNQPHVGVTISLDDGRAVRFGISDGQSCCEDFNYLHPADDYPNFVGAEYQGLREIYTWPASIDNPYAEYGFDAGGFQAIEVATDRGPLQFVVYNAHNGYYSHSTVIVDGDKIKESGL
jgi:hypothetical protein